VTTLGAVDVWSIDMRVAARRTAQLAALLDDHERERASRFVKPTDALRYRIAHGALRTILGGVTGIAPGSIRFSYGEHGKPLLPGGPSFSLSHSGALALVAVTAGSDVGIDVEEIRALRDVEAMAGTFFTANQARSVVAQSHDRDARFTRIWTAMEAVRKAEGTGLADQLEPFEVHGTDRDRARASKAGDPRDAGWSVRWLTPTPLHIAAVALRGDDFAVRARRFA
jgi:4'-phosphopantetheinyl transferase